MRLLRRLARHLPPGPVPRAARIGALLRNAPVQSATAQDYVSFEIIGAAFGKNEFP
jgi:hypothetical protein